MSALLDEALRIMRENAGAVESRVRRQTGRIVTVYRNDEAGMDDDGGAAPYSTVCEPHGTVCSHGSLVLARRHASDPLGWCEPCMYPEQEAAQ